MAKESLGQLTWREISPLGRIPKKYINKLLNKDPETIQIVKKWIDKNGLIILFTQGKVKGWEKVWVSDDGIIYINDEEHLPTVKELDDRIKKIAFIKGIGVESSLLGKDVPKKDKLVYLKERERPI
jgi:hypothetical protein